MQTAKYPTAQSGKGVFVMKRGGGMSDHVDLTLELRYFQGLGCSGTQVGKVVQATVAGWLTVTGTKDVDGYRADKVMVLAGGVMPAGPYVFSVRPSPTDLFMLNMYSGDPGGTKDADGYPDHFLPGAVWERLTKLPITPHLP